MTKTFRRRNAPNPFTALYHLKTSNLAVPLSHPLLQSHPETDEVSNRSLKFE
jgi:hypothetical protein